MKNLDLGKIVRFGLKLAGILIIAGEILNMACEKAKLLPGVATKEGE